MSKWDDKLPMIREMAGAAPTADIAAALGTSVNNLHKICHRNGISLPRDPESYTGRKKKEPQGLSIEQAKELLLDAGYRVIAPDPFRRVGT